jgi:hypothetical protein
MSTACSTAPYTMKYVNAGPTAFWWTTSGARSPIRSASVRAAASPRASEGTGSVKETWTLPSLLSSP